MVYENTEKFKSINPLPFSNKMAKYRGKHNGKTRGKYSRKKYFAVSRTEEELYRLHESLNEYLCNCGEHVSSCMFVDHWDNSKKVRYEYAEYVPYTKQTDTYHLAGATIGLDIFAYVKKPKSSPQFKTTINMVSNDSLDDVCNKLLTIFSVFNEMEY